MPDERLSQVREILSRGLDAASSAHLEKYRTATELLKSLGSRQSPKQERLVASMNFVGRVVPGFEEFCAKHLTSTDKFPVRSSYPLIYARSGENVVFVVGGNSQETTEGHPYVMKVNRESVGKPRKELEKIASRTRTEYELIRSWYECIPGFVPPELTIITHSHRKSLPAVVTLQPFIAGKKRGIFEDFTGEGLTLELNSNGLKEKFIGFAQRTLERFHETGDSIDILGEANVMVVENHSTASLVLIDPHNIYNLDQLRQEDPDKARRLERRIDELSLILSKVETNTG